MTKNDESNETYCANTRDTFNGNEHFMRNILVVRFQIDAISPFSQGMTNKFVHLMQLPPYGKGTNIYLKTSSWL